MKNLFLVRHAKSSWDAPLQDFDRPLTNEGIKAAHLVSSNISAYIPKTYVIYSSPAKRASETAVIFAQNISFPIESITYKDELYTFNGNQLENFVKTIGDNYQNIILFGHNGAITDFVNKFGDNYIDNVPTAGFVALAFEVNNWQDIEKSKIVKRIFPKDLK